MVAAVDDDLAVDHDGGDADGVAVRVLVGRAIGDPGRVEHRHVRPGTRPEQATICGAVFGGQIDPTSEIQVLLDRVCQEGWELVTVRLGVLSNMNGCIFKREVLPAP